MEKLFLDNEHDYDEVKERLGNEGCYDDLSFPLMFPCVLVYLVQSNKNCKKDTLHFEYVYFTDYKKENQ